MRELRSAAESDGLPRPANNEFAHLSLRRTRVEVQRFDPTIGARDKAPPVGRASKRSAAAQAASPLEAAASGGTGGATFDGVGFGGGTSGPSPSALGPDSLQAQGGNGASAQSDRQARKGKSVQVTLPVVRNSVTGLSQLRKHIEDDMPQLASQAVNYRRSATAEAQSSGNAKGKKAKAAAEARDRDIQTTKSWRPEGRMVGHMGEHKGAVNKIVVSPDQRFFASASDDGSVRIWECGRLEGRGVTNESRQQFTKQGGKIKHIAIGEGGQVSSESIPLVFGCCR